MKDLLIVLAHLLTTAAKLLGPGGARAVVADSLLMKQQLLVIQRSRLGVEYAFAATRTQSFDTGSVSAWLLVTVSRSTPYSAGCGDYSAIDVV